MYPGQMGYHNPVLLNECIEGLRIKPEGTYVDVTFGGGGHSKLILSHLKGGRLFAFDQDESTRKNSLSHPGFKLIHANFRYIKNFLKLEGILSIDGLIADLGVSSHQFDVPERGFSTRLTGDLDMRMDVNSDLSAKDVINDYTELDLANIFYRYGELRNSRLIANKIVAKRKESPINTTDDLVSTISNLSTERHRNQFLARVFQSIRIEVNDEIEALKQMLLSALELLNPSGRLVVLSYHSLEDRIVKNFMKFGNLAGQVDKDFFGRVSNPFTQITKKPLTPNAREIHANSKSRSAKLRICQKK